MSITRRGKVYHLRIRPFGPELVTVRTPAQTKGEALAIERAILAACRANDFRALDPESRAVCISMFQNRKMEIPSDLSGNEQGPQRELTLWEGADLFLNYPEIKRSKERSRYTTCLTHLVKHFGKEAAVKSIWVPAIKQYVAERINAGASPSTINREKGTLSKLFQVLVEYQLVDVNPCRLVKNLSQKSEERQVYLSFKDVQRIIDLLPQWFEPIVRVAHCSGLRRGEILGLKRKQVSLSRRMILLGPEETKERHWKRVPIHRDLISEFEEVLKVHTLGQDKVFLVDAQSPHPDTIKHAWRKAVSALGFKEPRPRFHDLRHTWRANARRSGMDPDIAEGILGHWNKGRAVNQRYGYVDDQELIRAIDRLTFDHGQTQIFAARQ